MSTCKHIDCNTIVADPKEDYCRQHRLEHTGAGNKKSPSPLAPDSAMVEETLEDALGLLDASDENIQEKLRQNAGLHPGEPQKGYLPFPSVDIGGDWVIQAMPQCLFKPVALMVWGYDDDTVITGAYVGNFVQGAASFGELPAAFFGTAKTYEKLVEDFAKNGISPPNWITWKTCILGNVVSIRGRGPLKHAVMLGKMGCFRSYHV